MTSYRAGEVEVLLTVNDQDVDRAEKNVKTVGQRIEKKPITAKVNADEADAIAGMDRVESAAKRIVSQDVVARVDANIERGEKNLARIQGNLDYLKSVSTELDVRADISRAEASLRKVERNLDGLRSARATMEVDADTSAAEAALNEVADDAEDAGGDGGRRGGAALVGGIVGALASIPIAGAIAGIAHTVADTIASEFQSALQIEVRQDRLEALTGIDEASAGRFARVAAEAYASNFGESIESNMNTTRLALQFDLIDEAATTRDAKKVVEGLAGIADVLDEDVQPVARAVTQLLRTGLSRSAQDAFDLLATGAREGVNVGEDLLDTYSEYSTIFRRLGLDGPQSLGLLSQALRRGARDSDTAADALKAFTERVGDPAMRDAFERVGFSWDDLSQRLAQGGPVAAAALDETLDRLRAIEDPALRDAAALELFGSKSEDLAAALYGMDLSSAVDELNGVQGAAQAMFDTIADNDASQIEQAQRNIEVAAEGIKGALASAFAEPLGEAANWIAANRGPVLQFFLDLANGALDFGELMVESAASGTEALGSFIAGPGADMLQLVANVQKAINPFADTSGIDATIESMRGFEEQTNDAADAMRITLGGAISTARTEMNEFAEPQVALGFLYGASLRLATAIDGVGYSADGSRIALEGFDAGNARATSSGALLEDQVRSAISALSDEIEAAALAGESQETLGSRYQTATDALRDQLGAMGLTEAQAQALIDTVLQTPPEATTTYSSNAPAEQAKVQALADRTTTLPDGTVVVNADTLVAENEINNTARTRTAYIDVVSRNGGSTGKGFAGGGGGGGGGGGLAMGGPVVGPGGPREDLVPIWASNGEHMLTAAEVTAAGGHDAIMRLRRALRSGALRGFATGGPIEPISISASTWRNDPPVQVTRVAGGGAPVATSPASGPKYTINVNHHGNNYSYDPSDIAREERERLTRVLDALPNA